MTLPTADLHTVFQADAWRVALERYGAATGTTVAVYDAPGRPVLGPVHRTPLFEAVNRGLQMTLADAQVFEATLFGLVASTEDMREGTQAFLQKRKAEFTGK